jgi:folate-dependent phosphoribosylglycinamide formyltransferase PurN
MTQAAPQTKTIAVGVSGSGSNLKALVAASGAASSAVR